MDFGLAAKGVGFHVKCSGYRQIVSSKGRIYRVQICNLGFGVSSTFKGFHRFPCGVCGGLSRILVNNSR